MADTHGFHRGTKPVQSGPEGSFGKQVCTIQYECHPDYFNPNGFSFMPRSLFQTIDSKYKNIFDYIEVI
jgi:hypothetical protein